MNPLKIFCTNFTRIGESCTRLTSDPSCLLTDTCHWVLSKMTNGRCQGFNCQLALDSPGQAWKLWTPSQEPEPAEDDMASGSGVNTDLLISVLALLALLVLLLFGCAIYKCVQKGLLDTLVIRFRGFFFGLRTTRQDPEDQVQVPGARAIEMDLINLS